MKKLRVEHCPYPRMVSHCLEKCITLKERIMRPIKDGAVILDFNDVAETNHITSQTKELCAIEFGSLESIVILHHGLLNLSTQEMSFLTTFFDRTTVNMASYFEVEQEIDEEGGSKENCLGEKNKIVATLETMPMFLN